ncbi:MAG: FHA domain-containing protein [Clostridia bacterium]|nr:FHA domain-containing protein [Clostridia bacterium]
MLVTLIGNNKMYKITLPENIEGDYWISDNSGKEEVKLANIRSCNGKWILKSNKHSKIINEKYVKISEESISIIAANNIIVDEAELKNYSKYYISPRESEDLYVLFCSPSYERNVVSLEPKNNEEISIGNGKRSDIYINSDIVSDFHASISKKNGNWIIENFDNNIKTFKNDICIDDEYDVIENGDIIFICGVKIMILGNTINIFGPINNVKISYKNLTKITPKNDNPQIIEDFSDTEDEVELYTENDYFYNSPRIRDKIEQVNVSIDQPPKAEGIGNGGIMRFFIDVFNYGYGKYYTYNISNNYIYSGK